MKVVASAVSGVAIYGPGTAEFEAGLAEILGTAPRELIKGALPYSVILENTGLRTVSFFGVRFDMQPRKGRQVSVVHYADSLRNPEKGDFRPGTKRFVCAEPEYTALLIRGDVAPRTRGRMNLDNLRRMIETRASLDCVAFEDGFFEGPDSQQAFERLACERESELAFAAEVMRRVGDGSEGFESFLYGAVEDSADRARRMISRKMLEALKGGGMAEVAARARAWRCRIALRREKSATGCGE
jgi:hypothetical protein